MSAGIAASTVFGTVLGLGIWIEHWMVTTGRWPRATRRDRLVLLLYRVALVLVAIVNANITVALMRAR